MLLRGSSHARDDINLWRIPLRLALGAIALFGLTMIPDTLDALGIIHLPGWLTMGGIDDARAILSAMMGSVSTVLALIFSVALLVLSMVATLFGPRLLYRFLQDWVTQVTLGLFMATFIFICLVFLVTHQDATSKLIPQVSLIVAWLLVLLSFGFLVFYSHRIAVSIQNPDLVARIVDDLRPALREQTRAAVDSHAARPAAVEPAGDLVSEGATVAAWTSGYVQRIDGQAIVQIARRLDANVQLLFRPGQFVFRGEPIASVSPPDRVTAARAAIERNVKLGRHRVLRQDCEFGIAQIVEIAIRALSPAVNDTFTGVACVDWLGDALLVIAEEELSDGRWYDDDHRLRLRVPALRLERLVKLACDQIRQAATDTPAVLIRLLGMLGRIAPRLRTPEQRTALRAQADAIHETVDGGPLVKLDRVDVEAAFQRACVAIDLRSR
jgi:uncharacterized membrane protein